MRNQTSKERITETARKLAIVLASKTVELPLKQAIDAILFNAASESNTQVTDAKLIEISFPIIMENLELEYSRGIFHSLESILDCAVSESEFDTKLKILDLSAQPENLNINSEKELAELLSQVLNHPDLPDKVLTRLGDAISDCGSSPSLYKYHQSPKVIYEYLFGGDYD